MFDALPAWATALLERAGVTDFDVLQRQLTAALAQGSQLIATQAFGIGLDTFGFVGSLGVTLYLAFFRLRDGTNWPRPRKPPCRCRISSSENWWSSSWRWCVQQPVGHCPAAARILTDADNDSCESAPLMGHATLFSPTLGSRSQKRQQRVVEGLSM